jgi:hypothetical protein
MRNIRTLLIILIPALMGGFYANCTDKDSVGPNSNVPPETHLFLQFSDTLQLPGETVSMQVLYWYGDDPDGEVIGFEYKWDYDSAWIFTTDVMDTFFVPIAQPKDTFIFQIRAIDDKDMRDPTPDRLSFPVRNSPPSVFFPIDFVQRYSRREYNCFSYFSIGWSSSDPDGDATITNFDWFLADSSYRPWDSTTVDSIYWNSSFLDPANWQHLDSLTTKKIFNDLQPGSYRLFLRCRDVADAYSNIIYYPDTVAGSAWNVMPVRGSVLFVDDDQFASNVDSLIPISLANMYGPDGFSTWVTIARISYYPRDIEETLKLFDKIIWHGGSYPHFRDAGDAITSYIAAGKHLLVFSTQRAAGDTTLYPFLPVDSIRTPNIGVSFWADKVDSCSVGQIPDGYPDTLTSLGVQRMGDATGISPGSPPGLIPRPVDALYTLRGMYSGIIDTIAVRYPAFSSGPAQVVYFAAPVYLCSSQIGGLLEYILEEEFR